MPKQLKIGVVDSGIDERIVPHVIHAFKSDYDDYVDRLGHGTACARIIRDQCADCEIVNLKIFDNKLITSTNNIIRAIRWSADNDIQIINLSLSVSDLNYYYELEEACRYASQKGVYIVASADNLGRPCLPAYLDHVWGVGIASLPNEDSFFYVNDSIQFYTNGYLVANPPQSTQVATSFATARMTGIIANCLRTNPNLTRDRLKNRLKRRATRFAADKILLKNESLDLEKIKNRVRISNDYDLDKLGTVSFVGTEATIGRLERYKEFLRLKKYNLIEIKSDKFAVNTGRMKGNYTIQSADYRKPIRQCDALLIDEKVMEKACWDLIEELEGSDKKVFFINRYDVPKYEKANVDCRHFHSEFENRDAIIDQLNTLPVGYIVKNNIPIMLLINMSDKNDLLDLELKLKQKLHASACKTRWISCHSLSPLFDFDYSLSHLDALPQNLQIPYIKCIVDTINQNHENSNLIIASVNSLIPSIGSSDRSNTDTIRDITLGLSLSPDFIVCLIDDTMELERTFKDIDLVEHFMRSKLLLVIKNPILERIDKIEFPKGSDRNKLMRFVSSAQKTDWRREIENRKNVGLFDMDREMDSIVDAIVRHTL